MRRLAIALLLALYVGLVPFALGHAPLLAIVGLAAILFAVQCIVKPEMIFARHVSEGSRRRG